MSSSREHRDRDRGPDSDQVRSDEVQDIAERLAKRFKMMARGSSRSLNLEDVFDRFDVERVGSISVIEFERLLEDEVEFVLSRREMRALTGKFDRNKDGRVDRREFMDFCFSNGYSAPPKLTQRELDLKFQEARKRVQRGFDESRSVGRIREHIRMFKDRDIDRTGKIPVRDFERVVEQLDMRLLREEQRAIVERFGSRGLVDYEEFLRECGGSERADPMRAGGQGGRRVDGLIRTVQQELKDIAGGSSSRGLQDVFDALDANNNGYISVREFRRGLDDIGLRGVSDDDVRDLVERFDKDRNGQIDYREFMALCGRGSGLRSSSSSSSRYGRDGEGIAEFENRLRVKLRQSASISVSGAGVDLDLRSAFDELDTNGSGYIEKSDFRRMGQDYGWDLTMEEFRWLVNRFDKDGDGRIRYSEFVDFMSLGSRDLQGVEGRFRRFLQKKNAEGVRFEEQFEWFDQDGSGFISESNFIEGMRKLGFAMSREDIRRLMDKFDSNWDGKISYREFLEAFAFGSDGQGMMLRGARSLRPSGGLTRSLTSSVPTRRLKDDPERWTSGLFYDCKCISSSFSGYWDFRFFFPPA